MNPSKIETTIGLCVVALTRHIMNTQSLNYEMAYRLLLSTELYKLLQDSETGLFLEPNQYLCKALDIELSSGPDSLFNYINT